MLYLLFKIKNPITINFIKNPKDDTEKETFQILVNIFKRF